MLVVVGALVVSTGLAVLGESVSLGVVVAFGVVVTNALNLSKIFWVLGARFLCLDFGWFPTRR